MANVVLLDKDGNRNTHSIGRGIRLFSEDGVAQDFFPSNSEEVTVELDFSEGDMVVEPSEDSMLEKVTITKPSNLIPEKIAEGIEIAGVVGSFKGASGTQLEGYLVNESIYQIDLENKEFVVYAMDYDKLFDRIDDPQLEIPNTVGELDVVICTKGVG